MDDCAHHPGERVLRRRVEFRVQAVLRRKWGLVRVPQSQVQSEVFQHLPVILYVGLVPSPPQQPTGLGLGEGGAGDRAQQEVGEGVARVRGEWRPRTGIPSFSSSMRPWPSPPGTGHVPSAAGNGTTRSGKCGDARTSNPALRLPTKWIWICIRRALTRKGIK